MPLRPCGNTLNVTAMRGVCVDIIMPSKSNLPYVHWASQALWWQVLERGCRIWVTPPPFDHTKLMLVDGIWSCFGSTNWDTRSLRLNFELDVECYERDLAGRLDDLVASRIAVSRPYTLEDADGRPFPVRVRDGVARLFAPYL